MLVSWGKGSNRFGIKNVESGRAHRGGSRGREGGTSQPQHPAERLVERFFNGTSAWWWPRSRKKFGPTTAMVVMDGAS